VDLDYSTVSTNEALKAEHTLKTQAATSISSHHQTPALGFC